MDSDPRTSQDGRPTVRLLHYADLENAFDDPARIGRLAARVDARRDDRTLVLGAGDDTALGVLGLLTDDGRAQARPFFERVEPDADTFGNHDFDFGREWALEWATERDATYCCANLVGPGVESVPDGTVFERGGARVGVVGLAHPETDDVCGAIDDLRFTDPAPAAREAFAALPDVDYRVVCSHCGEYDSTLAADVDADVILGGHVHERRVARVDGTLCVRTDGNGLELSEVTLGADPDVAFHRTDDEDGSVDAALDATYRERRERLGVDEVVAHVEDPLRRTAVERYQRESRLGNFAADAFRAAADADVGLFPGGSLRPGPPLSGAVTVADVVGCCPFGGSVVECELDGEQLWDAMAAVAEPLPGDRGWVQFQVSGLRVVWTDADAVRTVERDGEPVDSGDTYSVATAQYAVDVDGYGPLDWERAVAEHCPQYEALVEHARNGGLDVDVEGRIARVSAESSR